MPDNSRLRRRWQLSLKWLLLVAVPFFAIVALYGHKLRNRQLLLDKLRANDVAVEFYPDSGVIAALPDALALDCLRTVRSLEGDLASHDRVLKHFSSIERLELDFATESVVQDIQACPHLTWLNIGNADGVSVAAFADLGKHVRLRRLDLYEASHLAPAIPYFGSLRHLTCPVTTSEQVRAISTLSHLETLCLSFVEVSEPGIWNTLGRLTDLKRLKLSSTDLRGEDLAFLRNLQQLELLDLSYCTGVSDSVLRSASTLRLKCLRLGVYDGTQSEVSDDGLEYLGNSFESLEELDIFGSQITDESLHTLRNMVALSSLTIGDDIEGVESVLPSTRVTRVRVKVSKRTSWWD